MRPRDKGLTIGTWFLPAKLCSPLNWFEYNIFQSLYILITSLYAALTDTEVYVSPEVLEVGFTRESQCS